jgi:hypothetical protein
MSVTTVGSNIELEWVYMLLQSAVCPQTKTLQTHKIISSTKFPKLIFNSAPILSPISRAIHSVAIVKSPDNGITARAFDVNTR